jgi:hypothetical protein
MMRILEEDKANGVFPVNAVAESKKLAEAIEQFSKQEETDAVHGHGVSVQQDEVSGTLDWLREQDEERPIS